MAGINLLPWREAARKKSQQNFVISVVTSIALGVLVVGAAYTYMERQILQQEERNDYIQAEIKHLDTVIKEIETLDANRKALLDRIRIIETLQSTRPAIVHLFDEMVNALPNGLYLTQLLQEGTKIKLEGKAESSARVSSYMNNLNGSSWLNSSDLNLIRRDADNEQVRLRSFKLDVTQLLTDKENDNGN